MSRKKTEVQEYLLEELRNQIKKKSGLECNSFSQMCQLQHDIRKNINEYLSLQTLNRLFVIIKTDFNPSLNTLNLLCQYLRYNSFLEFSHLHSSLNTQKIGLSFELRFILSIVANVNHKLPTEHTVDQIARNICKLVAEDDNLRAGFYTAMASSEFGRKYFFELYPNIDRLDKEFGEGLKYYVLYTDNRFQLLLAYSLFSLRYFLTSDHGLFTWYCNLVRSYSVNEIMSYSPQLIGMYYSSMIFRQYINSVTDDEEIDLSVLHAPTLSLSKCMAAEALILTGEFELAWGLLNNNSNQTYSLFPSGNEEQHTQFNILWLMSGFYSKNINAHRALQMHFQLKDKPLKIESQVIYNMFMLQLKRVLFPKASVQKEVDAQVKMIIEKSGFIYFNEYTEKLNTLNDSHLMVINGKKR